MRGFGNDEQFDYTSYYSIELLCVPQRNCIRASDQQSRLCQVKVGSRERVEAQDQRQTLRSHYVLRSLILSSRNKILLVSLHQVFRNAVRNKIRETSPAASCGAAASSGSNIADASSVPYQPMRVAAPSLTMVTVSKALMRWSIRVAEESVTTNTDHE